MIEPNQVDNYIEPSDQTPNQIWWMKYEIQTEYRDNKENYIKVGSYDKLVEKVCEITDDNDISNIEIDSIKQENIFTKIVKKYMKTNIYEKPIHHIHKLEDK